MGLIFQDGMETVTCPVSLGATSAPEATHTSVKTRPDEGADDYVGVVARLNDRWRIIVCRDEMQWILQRRHDRNGLPRWEGNSYCQTRAALLRCIQERLGCHEACAFKALGLPERFDKGLPLGELKDPVGAR